MVPDGWRKENLGTLFVFKNGANAEAGNYGSGIKFVNVMDVFGNHFITADKIRARVNLTEEKIKLYLLKKGDVLFNRTSEVLDEIALTSVYMDASPAIFGGFVIRGRPKGGDLDFNYCIYCFSSSSVRRESIRRGQGAIRANIGQKDLQRVPMLVPPLPEQKKIARILSTWDRAIEVTEKLISNGQKQKKSLMQQLLTGKKRLAGFSGEWEKIELGELLDYRQPTPFLVKSTEYNDEFSVPVLTAGKTFVLGYTNESSGIFQDELPAIIFDDFTTSSKFVDFPFKAKSSAMKILTAKEGVSIKFVFEAMQMLNYAIGGHQRHWISIYSNLVINMPEFDEQQKIGSVLRIADQEIEVLRHKLDCFEQEKKALMQQLLTGKRRVVLN